MAAAQQKIPVKCSGHKYFIEHAEAALAQDPHTPVPRRELIIKRRTPSYGSGVRREAQEHDVQSLSRSHRSDRPSRPRIKIARALTPLAVTRRRLNEEAGPPISSRAYLRWSQSHGEIHPRHEWANRSRRREIGPILSLLCDSCGKRVNQTNLARVLANLIYPQKASRAKSSHRVQFYCKLQPRPAFSCLLISLSS